MSCDCLHCTISSVIHEHYPEGLDTQASSEVATVLAGMSGWLLADCSDETLERFFGLVRAVRAQHRSPNLPAVGGLH